MGDAGGAASRRHINLVVIGKVEAKVMALRFYHTSRRQNQGKSHSCEVLPGVLAWVVLAALRADATSASSSSAKSKPCAVAPIRRQAARVPASRSLQARTSM
jgi:hypothetical protein